MSSSSSASLRRPGRSSSLRPGRSRTGRVRYVRAVGDVLAAEFGWDDDTVAAFRSQEARIVDGPGHDATFEFICDRPLSASYRLRFGARPFELVLCDTRMLPHPEPSARVTRVNELLAVAYAAADM